MGDRREGPAGVTKAIGLRDAGTLLRIDPVEDDGKPYVLYSMGTEAPELAGIVLTAPVVA